MIVLKHVFLLLAFFIWPLLMVQPVWAQIDTENPLEEDDSTLRSHQIEADAEVESLYDKFDAEETIKRERRKRSRRRSFRSKKDKDEDFVTFSELSTLAPLRDIAVIQKRFLPKTKRFEFSGSLMGAINNPFFTSVGSAIRASYYFKEKYGVEFIYFLLFSDERAVTKNLRTKRNVKTENLVTANGFFGVDFKWTPVYGKMTFMNNRIIPFDFYFSAGAGLTQTDQDRSEPTIHFATGQAFAMSKKMAIRWDLSWNFYQGKTKLISDKDKETTTNQDDLYVSLGFSFFFPEATYR